MLKLKIYPNGETTFSWERRKKLEPLTEEYQPTEEQRIAKCCVKHFGVVETLEYYASANETADTGTHGLVKSGLFTQRGESVARRGSKGITRYSRRIIECGAALIEDRYEKSQCSFLTLTIPPSEAEWTIDGVNRAYNRFQTELIRKLELSGLPSYVVGCIEAHPERSKREGRMVPHFHLLFVGRKRYKSWAIPPQWFRTTWIRCLQNAGQVKGAFCSSAATGVETVRKSVTAYLGKYLSKAVEYSREPDAEGLKNEHPGSWHKISRKLLTLIKKQTKVRKGRQAERLLEILRQDTSGSVRFITSVYLDNQGEQIWIGEYCRIDRKSIKYFLQLSGDASLVE